MSQGQDAGQDAGTEHRDRIQEQGTLTGYQDSI